jgi:PHP family Zn ribbon phosphoesterase
MLAKFGNELNIVLDAPEEELRKNIDEKIVTLILKNRTQQIKWQPGYDGEYGHPVFDGQAAVKKPAYTPSQKSLGEF